MRSRMEEMRSKPDSAPQPPPKHPPPHSRGQRVILVHHPGMEEEEAGERENVTWEEEGR